MTTFIRTLNVLVLLALALVSINIVAIFVPWYTQETPMRIENREKVFKPGDTMKIYFNRYAVVGFNGRVVRELVRLHENVEEEVWKVSYDTTMDAGSRRIAIFYKIPKTDICPQMASNTFIWRGAMIYRPLGLVEKRFVFETEKFQIEVPSPVDQK